MLEAMCAHFSICHPSPAPFRFFDVRGYGGLNAPLLLHILEKKKKCQNYSTSN